ncbi:Clavaminate synthase-like protein [Roridomyces roridus]|uniref:Clavaminate synthase-like protein n=1 Tax=Roridomyces roridus TaxID=1738132 RepID=A0AAD7C0L1_9AGAR|nr:Clavaminate synthase-like protein [Roridomyces roridus]
MPVALPTFGSFDFVAQTKENLPWADLPTLDLSLYSSPSNRTQLAQELISAIHTHGFFYVKNFGVAPEAVDRQFDIGRQFYEQVPLSEKMLYVPPNFTEGGFNGYMPAGRIVVDPNTGLRDKVEVYNIPKFNGDFAQDHPDAVARNLVEIEVFVREIQKKIVEPLLTLVAIALELPEDYLTNMHQYEVKSEDHIRYMKCGKHPMEDNKRLAAWVPGHTDLGSFTLLFRQPVAGLQIADPTTGEWRYVRPQNGMLTVNTCDALQLLTAGYVKSTVHRVVPPPVDQQQVDRLGLLYFSRPHNDVKLATIQDSPLLKREGYIENLFEASGNPVPTMEEWTFAKQKWQRTGYLGPKEASKEVLPGFSEKVYT